MLEVLDDMRSHAPIKCIGQHIDGASSPMDSNGSGDRGDTQESLFGA
jgi:hypothetical protein